MLFSLKWAALRLTECPDPDLGNFLVSGESSLF